MKKIIVKLYGVFSPNLRKILGKSRFLKPLRDRVLRSNHGYKEVKVIINHDYQNYNLSFPFFASIQVASKAKKKGVENKLLKSSISLISNLYKENQQIVILDIGANFGFLSLVWAQSVAKHGKIVAFEPNPTLAKTFKKSVLANDLQEIINIETIALGNKNEIIEIYNYSETSNTLKEVNSHLTDFSKNEIQMCKLDDYVEHIDLSLCHLIKIDVDGIELEILNGAINFIKKYKPIVIVELNNKLEIAEFLKGFGYLLLDLDLKPIDVAHLPPNIFAIPANLNDDFVI